MFDSAELIRHYSVTERGNPHMRANFIASLDGAASFAGLSAPLNNAADKQVFDTLRMLSDVVLVGAGTLRTEDYGPLILDDDSVAWRLEHGLAPHPVLAIVSGRLELNHGSDVFRRAPVRPLIFTYGTRKRVPELAAVADIESCGEYGLDVAGMRAALVRRGLTQVLAEGGPHLFASLVAADAVDELCLTLSPFLAGGGAGRIAAGEQDTAMLRTMRLAHVLTAGDMLMLRYVRSR